MEEKRRQLERELSALRSDLAGQDEEQMLREQERQVFYYNIHRQTSRNLCSFQSTTKSWSCYGHKSP